MLSKKTIETSVKLQEYIKKLNSNFYEIELSSVDDEQIEVDNNVEKIEIMDLEIIRADDNEIITTYKVSDFILKGNQPNSPKQTEMSEENTSPEDTINAKQKILNFNNKLFKENKDKKNFSVQPKLNQSCNTQIKAVQNKNLLGKSITNESKSIPQKTKISKIFDIEKVVWKPTEIKEEMEKIIEINSSNKRKKPATGDIVDLNDSNLKLIVKEDSKKTERKGKMSEDQVISETMETNPNPIQLEYHETLGEADDAVSFVLDYIDQNNTKQNSTNANDLITKKYVCEICLKRFMKKSNLVDHLRLHADQRLYKCPHCERSFVQSGNFKAHLRIHTNERPFVCSYCNKSYNQSGALKIHLRSHTNERNYVCNVCSKGFTNSSDLKKHQLIHDQNKRHRCQLCDKPFTQKSHLKKHLLSKHKMEI